MRRSLHPRSVGSCLLLAGISILAACRPPEASGVRVDPGTPFVLISIDTLRSDHLPAYGYEGVDTPAIDRLRREGILFERAYSPAPLTLPAHASLLTGAPPTRHGVRDNIGYTLDGSLPTLGEALAGLGYRTGAAVSAFVLRRQTGIGRGFEHFDDRLAWEGFAVMGDVQRPGAESLAAVRDWLAEVAGGPFFLFLHFYEPHAPYLPPPELAARYASAYDGEIAAVDRVVGAVRRELEERGAWDRSVVLLTSDHGEGLGEHGEAEHGVLLYRESLQVPLILKLPSGELAGASVARPVRLTDVPVTFLTMLGAAVPESMRGVSLLDGPERGTPAVYSETYYPRLRLGWSALQSLIDGRYHYVHGPDPELYDLEADPQERRNLIRRERRRAAELAALLASRTAAPERPHEGDAEAREALLSLGYLSGSAADVPEDDGDLPDPKARIHTLERLDRGLATFRAGDASGAAELLREAVREIPGAVVGWEFLGRALLQLGDVESAYEALATAFRLAGGAPHLAEQLARAALGSGRLEEAAAHLEQAVARKPESVPLRLIRGRVLLQLGRYAEALEVAEGVRREHPENADAAYLCGTVRIGLGLPDEAENDLRRALALAPDHTAAMSDLAVLLASRGRRREARELVERLLALRPRDRLAHELLADLEPGD